MRLPALTGVGGVRALGRILRAREVQGIKALTLDALQAP